MKAVTWNVGCYIFLNWAVKRGLSFHGQKIVDNYFQPVINGGFVSDQLTNFDADIVFLQEIHSAEDIPFIPVLTEYPHQLLLPSIHHEHCILVAAKQPFKTEERDGFTFISLGHTTFLPLHLDAHHSTLRLADAEKIAELVKQRENIVVLGDSNMWSLGKHCYSPTDGKAYRTLTQQLLDISASVGRTTPFSFAFDKVFVSTGLQASTVHCERRRSHFMDHYPLIIDVKPV